MSSYLGAIEAEKTTPGNVVDIITISNPATKQYILSQDVPGSYEANVMVVQNGLVLTPEVDYSIDNGTTLTFQSNITLGINDNIFVLHRGTGTYNLVPSPRSVTEDSLAENLRGFIFDSFVGTGATSVFTLSQEAYNAKSILVTYNGTVIRPTFYTVSGTTLTMTDPSVQNPPNTVTIGVLHLGFSTVLRRSDYLTSIVLSPNLIQTVHINNDAVNGDKILLENDQAIRSLLNTGGLPLETDLIKVDLDNRAVILNAVAVAADLSSVAPVTGVTQDLGTSASKFRDLNLSRDVNAARDVNVSRNVNITGDLAVAGTIVGSDTIPVGVVFPYYGSTAPAKYLLCDGTDIPAGSQYDSLRTMLAAAPGHANPAKVPDMRQKVLVGTKAPADSAPIAQQLGQSGGSFQHTHDIPNHNHAILASNITAITDSHLHGVGTYSATTPGHTHAISGHTHPLADHYHCTDTFHKHTLSIDADSFTHSHNVNYLLNKGSVAGSDIRTVRSDTQPDVVTTTSYTYSHSHTGVTFTFGTAAEDWGNPSMTCPVSKRGQLDQTRVTRSATPSNSFSSTNYNTALTGGLVTQSSPLTISMSGLSASTSGLAVTVNGTTEDKTSLAASLSTAQSQPYITVNYIIRAIA